MRAIFAILEELWRKTLAFLADIFEGTRVGDWLDGILFKYPMTELYGCPNSKKVEKLNLKRVR